MRVPKLVLVLVVLACGRSLTVHAQPVPTAGGPAIELPPEVEAQAAPMQSEVILGDQPPSAVQRAGIFTLSRQGQIDVALDPRTRKLRGAAVGGYGEAVVLAPLGAQGGPVVADLRRNILFFGFNFTDRIRFFSEIEFEHALTTSGKEGEVAVEQAFLDFLLTRWLNVRAGMSIVPVSLVNLYHEPSTFHGVERPDSDLFIVPSTWKQLMAGLFGAVGPVRYQLYVTPGLRAEGFSADTGIRGGVQDNLVRARDWGLTGRVDYSPILGLNLGLSMFWAFAGQGDPNLGATPVTIAAFDGKFQRAGLSLRTQVSYLHIGDTGPLNVALSLVRPGAGSVSRQIIGGYVEVAYDVLRAFRLENGFQLLPFVRIERSDTQADVQGTGLGFSRKPGNDRTVFTAGLTFRPILEIAAKLDYQYRVSDAPDSGRHTLNAGIAYQF